MEKKEEKKITLVKGSNKSLDDSILYPKLNPAKDSESTKITVGSERKKQQTHLGMYLIIIIALLLLIIIILALVYIYFAYFSSSERYLETGENIEFAYIKGGFAHVKIIEQNLSNVSQIKFKFISNDESEHVYSTNSVQLEYEIKPEDIGLDNFDSIKKVSAALILKTEKSKQPINPIDDSETGDTSNPKTSVCGDGKCNGTENSINCAKDCKKSSDNGGTDGDCTPSCAGKKCGNNGCGGTCPPGCAAGYQCNSTFGCSLISCTNDTGCDKKDLLCAGSMPYNCTNLDLDICLERTNLTACSSGWQCSNGTGCIEIKDCTTANVKVDCASSFKECSYGICNSTGNCELKYNQTQDLCRAASGECDISEYCLGNSASCSADLNKTGAACTVSGGQSGICQSGVCVQQGSCGNGACDTEENCGNCAKDCACSQPTPFCSNSKCAECISNENCNSGESCTEGTCTSQVSCGNSIIEGNEVCDTLNVGWRTCTEFFEYSYDDSISCCNGCDKLDLSDCKDVTYTKCNEGNDGGINYEVYSKTSSDYTFKSGPDCNGIGGTTSGSGGETQYDECENSQVLNEKYCAEDNSIANIRHDCSIDGKQCSNGACYKPLSNLNIWVRIKQILNKII